MSSRGFKGDGYQTNFDDTSEVFVMISVTLGGGSFKNVTKLRDIIYWWALSKTSVSNSNQWQGRIWLENQMRATDLSKKEWKKYILILRLPYSNNFYS
jgi:hypothetical protein